MFRAGMPIWLCPEIQATHLKRWTLSSLWRTDVFARAVPWTRLVLGDARLPDDLNLGWRSRASALSTWAAAALLLASTSLMLAGHAEHAWKTMLGGAACLSVSTLLNADLHRFFYRRGGLRFASGAWLLHHAYLLYSSAVFGALLLAHAIRRTPPGHAARTGGGNP